MVHCMKSFLIELGANSMNQRTPEQVAQNQQPIQPLTGLPVTIGSEKLKTVMDKALAPSLPRIP